MNKFRIYIALTVCSLSAASFAAGDAIASILRSSSQKKTKFAILAVRADNNQRLYSYQSDSPMIPASNMKLITTAAAVHYLGAEFVFETQVGLVNGDLVIIGNGDPLLADEATDTPLHRQPGWVMDTIVQALRANDIKELNNIIIDTSYFDNHRVHSSWPKDQLNQWYACEVCGLNYNGNCLRISARRQGGKPILETIPGTSYVTLINQIRVIKQGSNALGAYRNSKLNHLIIKGNLKDATSFDVAIEEPQGLFACLLREKLTAEGITVRGALLEQYIKNRPDIRIIHSFKTPLASVLSRCNKDSFGLAAESLIKTISAERTKDKINGEWEHGLSLVGQYLDSLGARPGTYQLDDGSGLSRNNRLSPDIIVSVLSDLYQQPAWPMFEQTLAVGGEDGTVSKYFHAPAYRGKILGKTGYIAGVRAFSGICKTPGGDILFSILTENGNGLTREVINDITESIFDWKF